MPQLAFAGPLTCCNPVSMRHHVSKSRCYLVFLNCATITCVGNASQALGRKSSPAWASGLTEVFALLPLLRGLAVPVGIDSQPLRLGSHFRVGKWSRDPRFRVSRLHGFTSQSRSPLTYFDVYVLVVVLGFAPRFLKIAIGRSEIQFIPQGCIGQLFSIEVGVIIERCS